MSFIGCSCLCYIFKQGVIVLQGGQPPRFHKRWEVMQMSTYEVLTLLILFGTFLVALLVQFE